MDFFVDHCQFVERDNRNNADEDNNSQVENGDVTWIDARVVDTWDLRQCNILETIANAGIGILEEAGVVHGFYCW